MVGLLFLLPANGNSSERSPVITLRTIAPFAPGEFGYSLSVVSDSSVWYSTNKCVFHLHGSKSEKELDDTLFTKSQLEVLLVDALADDDVWALGHDTKNWEKTLFHFNGTSWKRMMFPQVSADSVTFMTGAERRSKATITHG